MIHTEETKAQVSKLWADGKSAREVGAEIGMTRNAVIGLVHRLGLPKRETDLRRGVRGWTARKMKPTPPPLIPAPDPIGPIGDFPARDTCHHIAGEPDGSFQCCGHVGYPFCEYHSSRVYLPKKVAA